MIDVLPSLPGCYIFKDRHGTILYVGKAKNLKKRVASYFNKKDHDTKTSVLVSQIAGVDFIATDNDVEAYILENNLIKKHSPKYNITLKDAKRYASLEITGEEYPRLIVARSTHPTTKNGKLFGPFVSGSARSELSEFLTRTFSLRTCRRLPKKACLRYNIKLCSGPCIGVISKEDYENDIKHAKDVLDGKTKEVIQACNDEMKKAAREKQFEAALNLRNIIDSLKWLKEKQTMERDKVYDEDIINYIVKDGMVYLLLFNISRGILERKQDFVFAFKDDFLEEFLVQFYSENDIPKEIILPKNVEESLLKFLSKKKGSKVNITVPKKGEKHDLLMLAEKNIEIMFFADEKKLRSLQDALNLESLPTIIECFDISHLSGTAMVGSMVQFRNAKPSKENYRRFKIRTVDGINDTAAIAEVVMRRYKRLKQENSEMPGLIIIDGGLGQLNAAAKELELLELKLPIISIAKEFEDIYVPGSSAPLQIDKKSSAQYLIRQIRDEAHRFAISYNKLLRKKQLVENE
jgi:excinuclease ABC subunit C